LQVASASRSRLSTRTAKNSDVSLSSFMETSQGLRGS
jgi:hypothetical protein